VDVPFRLCANLDIGWRGKDEKKKQEIYVILPILIDTFILIMVMMDNI